MTRFETADIRRYYDRHTPAFVSLGEGGDLGVIHRAVWAPGVADRGSAFRYVEDRIAEIIGGLPEQSAPPHVVDLGCGVGASLRYLAGQVPMRGTGVTLSPVQAELATRLTHEAGLSDRVMCLEGDYCDLPAGLGPVDVAYAIESFVHGPAPARFFDQCRRLIRPGGVLAICDDFRGTGSGPEAERTIEQFRAGWHINALLEQNELRALAGAAGFEHTMTVDLSPYLALKRPRDRAISALLVLVGWIPSARRLFAPLLGGRALQACLDKGWVRYELAVFRRLATDAR